MRVDGNRRVTETIISRLQVAHHNPEILNRIFPLP